MGRIRRMTAREAEQILQCHGLCFSLRKAATESGDTLKKVCASRYLLMLVRRCS